jgi:glycosyltransferase involved in cell wall biosynthesis
VNASIADYVQADHIVANGYDSTMAQNWRMPPDPARFVIGIPGSQHRGRLIEPLFKVLDLLRQRYPSEFDLIRLLQVGDVDREWWSTQLEEYLLTDRCDVLGYKLRMEYVRSLSKASMMFFGLSEDLDSAMIPSRMFELLASGRPILASVESDSAVAELIRRDESGFSFSCDTVDAAAEYLRQRILGFSSGREVVSALPSYSEEFSSDVMVEKFAKILDAVR